MPPTNGTTVAKPAQPRPLGGAQAADPNVQAVTEATGENDPAEGLAGGEDEQAAMARLASDLMGVETMLRANGSSLAGLLRKAAHQLLGVVPANARRPSLPEA